MNPNTHCDVLLVTVTDVETEALLETAKTLTGSDYTTEPGNHKTYFDLGMIGGVRVFAVRSEMGSDTVGGSLLTVSDAIAEVKPSAVIMVGIAFGVNQKKQQIGDILIAKQLQPYDLQRVGTTEAGERKINLRGDKLPCSTKLLDRFRTTHLKWKKAKVEFGLVLSGQKLIDNLDFKNQLLVLAEEAIGGEMEGAGVYVACQQTKVDGILVKAICDWADGEKGVEKEQKQKIAAQNAGEFVIEMLKSGLLAEQHSSSSTTDIAAAIQLPVRESSPLSPDKISIARLPVSGADLFGREAELQLLAKAWEDPNTNIITFVAWGGVGKTALVNHWLKQRMARDKYRGAERVYAWSFYSQGTSERAASADLFIDQALRWFGDTDPTAGSPWDKGERLARYIRQTRTLLILDGLEPLQHPPGAHEGRLKDAALQALLVELAGHQPGLCVISTRETVGDLVEFEGGTVIQHDLEQLSPQAGVQILRSLNVKGEKDELEEATKELGGHAFSLTLLGSYLDEVLNGDIQRRREIENLFDDTRYGDNAQKMIAAYETWLGEGIELAILRLLGLFDRPADAASVSALREAPVIVGLTEPLQHFKAREWNQAVAKLRRIKLLGEASPNEPGTIDAHPLVREHFKQQLKRERPDAWREGNNRLYEHLKRTAKELPDTIEEMSPLYAAVAHGCAAGKYHEALGEVYYDRIQRGVEHFNWNTLGAYGADLAVLSGFFDAPWNQLVEGLKDDDRAFLFGETGIDLRALGRLDEAVQLMRTALEILIEWGDWKNAAVNAGNFGQVYQTIGDLPQALKLDQQAVELSDRSIDRFQQLTRRANLAHVLHLAGHLTEAAAVFREAEDRLRQWQPTHSFLFAGAGFTYCTLLLDQERVPDVKERSARMLEFAKLNNWLLHIALGDLALGRAWLLEAQLAGSVNPLEATEFLERAVKGLRKAGMIEYLPDGLLARAELHQFNGEYDGAERDLAEVHRIATRSGMGLHLADYHLESARLQVAQGNQDKAREHWATAKEMIERMGYHRRDKEVDELEEQLG